MRFNASLIGRFSSADFRKLNSLNGKFSRITERKASDDTFVPKMNKTETMYYNEFLRDGDGKEYIVIPQPTRFFRLPGGGTYTPDFLVVSRNGIESIETKGSRAYIGYEQGIDRYNRCAEHFSKFGILFKLAEFDRKKGNWTVTTYDFRELN